MDLILIMAAATNTETPGGAAQFYQFILNLVPAIVSIFVSGQIVRYVYKYFSLRQEQKLKLLIESTVDPKIEKLEAKIDTVLKLMKDPDGK